MLSAPMKRTVCLMTLLCATAAQAKPAPPSGPVRFQEPSFSATFPAQPKRTTAVEKDMIRGAQPMEVHSFDAGANGVVAQVRYFDMPGLWNNADAFKNSQNLLKFGLRMQLLQLCTAAMQQLGGSLESTEKIALGDAFGMSFGGPLEQQLNGQATNAHGRVYFRGERIFVVTVIHTADVKGASAAAAFLESFAFAPPATKK